MTNETKNSIIIEIEKERNSRIITYIVGDGAAPFHHAQMGMDVFPIFSKHLKKIGHTEQIDLFLYATGGMLDMPWVLVNLIREYCNKFCVIITSRALSAATLLSLGADEIVMGPLGLLSPVDPITSIKDKRAGEDKQLEVENVMGFIELCLEKLRIRTDEGKGEILRSLTSQIDPLTLGGVHRTYSRIRQLADQMLKFHLKEPKDKSKRKKIAETLTKDLFSHSHLIGRKEAKETHGISSITFAPDTLEEKMDKLLQLYSDELYLEYGIKKFDITPYTTKEGTQALKTTKCVIGTNGIESRFIQEFSIVREGLNVSVNAGKAGWNYGE